jgi:hypothetical protein
MFICKVEVEETLDHLLEKPLSERYWSTCCFMQFWAMLSLSFKAARVVVRACNIVSIDWTFDVPGR